MSIYCISDIHGQYDAFVDMLVQIKFNPSNDKLYILGDIIDWGSKSMEIIKYCMDSNSINDSIEVLIGNHELMMLNFYDLEKTPEERDIVCMNWFYNQGDVTFDAFENESKQSQKEILQWLNTRKYYIPKVVVNGTSFYLAHSYPYVKIDNIKTHNETLALRNVVWKRVEKYDNPIKENNIHKIYGETVLVFGHSITETYGSYNENGYYKIFKDLQNNKIAIDCGAKCIEKFPCRLSCLRLDDLTEYYIKY